MKRYKPMHPAKRLAKMIRKTEQLIRDIEWWNANRTEHPPFDIGRELVFLAKLRECKFAWDRNDIAEGNRLHDQLQEFAKTYGEESAP